MTKKIKKKGFIRRLFCKHIFNVPCAQYLKPTDYGTLRTQTMWKCCKCGKIRRDI